MSAPAVFSQRLMQCLIKLELTEHKPEAKMELVLATNALMPQGVPDYLGMVKYEPLRDVIAREGRKKMLTVLVLLVKDFCASMNVVRNMTEDQMIECAAMLLEECGNFRLEDYVMMFAMAKRGQLIKIYDRLDIQVITGLLDEYWKHRSEAGRKELEREINEIESCAGENPVERKSLIWDDKNGYVVKKSDAEAFIGMAGAIEALKTKLKEV